MSVITRRTHTRNECRAPIRFTRDPGKESAQGEMINSSVGGMAFLAGCELSPGEGILIHLADFAPDPYWLDARQDFYAEVRWCVRAGVGEPGTYQVGVRFLMETCRLCDKTICHCSVETEHLCEDCFKRLCAISEGATKDCIDNFLMGNIL